MLLKKILARICLFSAMVLLPLQSMATVPSETSEPPESILYDFENTLDGWSAGEDTSEISAVYLNHIGHGGKVIKIALEQGKSASIRRLGPIDISRYRTLTFDVNPPKAYANMHVAAYFVDEDEHWYQTWQRARPPQGEWTTVEIDLSPEAATLEPIKHSRPWEAYVARTVQEMGIALFADRPVTGLLYIDNITLIPADTSQREQKIFNFETPLSRVGQNNRFEITFQLSRTYDNPFDPEEIEVLGHFATPSGKVVTVPGFFFQDFERRLDKKVESLIPMGPPKWKIRFAPTELGKHQYTLEICDSETIRTPPRNFTCIASENPGYMGVCDTDRNYFEFDDGSFFYPIGHNIPATFNIKGAQALGLAVAPHEGTYAYDRFLDGMARGGENFARIWLGSWSFGLEWSRKYHHSYRDLGRYNLENAWRFDYVLDRAERLGIYVQLALTTFGHFRSKRFEGDWSYSPYNSINGGPLQRPREFWTHAESLKTYQQMLRYVMARWGYSTHIAGWELSNEIDLVDDYAQLRPSIIAWHKKCAETIRQHDPNLHLVTTNFAQMTREPEILRLPIISYSSTNHYTAQIANLMRTSIYPQKSAFGKPAIMAECGYDFKGATPETTIRYLHTCLWTSYMIPFGGAGLSWWWDFIDDRDLYPMFRPLVDYAAGEDRRNRGLTMSQGKLVTSEGTFLNELIGDVLQNKSSAYFYIYERKLFRAESDARFTPSPRENLFFELGGFAPGEYRVEFWNTRTSGIAQELTATVKNGTLRVPTPTFTSDIAGKVKPSNE